MEPNKLETQIKEQLNAREIQPSEMAWDRLDAMLSVAEEKKTKRFSFLSFQSIGIAASVLVLVSLGLFFFNQKETVVKPEDDIVIKEKINSNETTKINEKNNSLKQNQQSQEVAVIKSQQSKISNQKSSKSFNQSNQKTTINPNQENSSNNQEVIAENSIPKIKIEEKPVQVKPQVDDIDALLASASKSNKEKNKKSDFKIKISASALLVQVDGEIEMTFREKVLKKVIKNYEEIKVAVTTRNIINENNTVKNNYK